MKYATVGSQQVNAMTASQFQPYRLLIVPGGNFEEIGNGLASDTTASIRDAVRGGLNYLGICAGAFFAGNSPYNGLNLTDGVRFNFVALEARGIRKAAVAITVAGSRRHTRMDRNSPVGARSLESTPTELRLSFKGPWETVG